VSRRYHRRGKAVKNMRIEWVEILAVAAALAGVALAVAIAVAIWGGAP
jgi:hypothetical protein